MNEERPLLEHLPSEFLTWLWFRSELEGGVFQLGEELGAVVLWVDDRIAFRAMDEDKPRAVLTGENPAATLEARAALAGGRVVRELRLGMKREDREYTFTLKGAYLDISGAKLPDMVKGEQEEVLYDRMYLYEELSMVVGALLRVFAAERTADEWRARVLPEMREWVSEAVRGGAG